MKKVKFLGKSIGALLLAVLLLASFVGAAAAASSDIGFVDMEVLQKKLPEYQHFQTLIEQKEEEFKLFQNYTLTQHQNTLKGLDEKLKSEKNGKSEEEQAAIEKKYGSEAQKKTEATQKLLQDKRNESLKALDAEQDKINAKVQKIIEEVAKEKKLSVVLAKGAILTGGMDITNLVLEKSNKANQTKGK